MLHKNFKTLITSLCVLSGVLLTVKPGFCETADDYVAEGKELLINHYDLYGADAKFAAALALDSAHQKANFWQAMTIIMTNPGLKNSFIDAGFFDASGNLTAFNEAGEMNLSYSTVPNKIIDNENTSAGYSETGSGWLTQDLPGSYSGDCRTHAAGVGENKAIWDFPISAAGNYSVVARWPYAPDNSTDAKYIIYHAGGSTVLTFNQRENSEIPVNLGEYKFTPASGARIELSDNTSTGQVVADFVSIEFNGISLDSESPDAVLSAGWSTVADTRAKGGQYKQIVSGTGESCVWTPDIATSGKYHLYAYWKASDANASGAVFEVRVNGALVKSIPVDQRSDNFAKISLGLFDLQAGTVNTITLLQNAGGKVTTDGIKLVPVRDYPDLTETQDILVSMLTEVDKAIACLDKITNTFQDSADFGATDSSGNHVITDLDYGDVLIIKGILNAWKFPLNYYGTYELSYVNAHTLGASYPSLLSANGILSDFPSLGTLPTSGASRLSAAKQGLINSINCYFEGYNFITSKTGREYNLITFGPDYEGTAAVMHPFYNRILSNLTGSTSFFTVTSDDFGPNFFGTYFKMNINFRAMFDNPLGVRSLLPQFDGNDELLRSTAPDPTGGGILPDAKQEDFNGIADLGSWLRQPLVQWNGDTASICLDWEADTYSDFTTYKIFRSTTDTVNETSQKVFESSTKSAMTFTDTAIDSNQRIYYYRLYTYYSDGDKTASPVKRVITKIYVDINNTTGTEDGSSQHPFSNLGDTIDEYGSMGGKICVAQGTYSESDTSLHMWNCSGLYLEGGYDPADWTKDINAHETIIDATGRSGWNVIGFDRAKGVIIDGFTIKGGSGLNDGSGVSCGSGSTATVRNCKLMNNHRGIGVWDGSACTVENCIITQNEYEGIGADDGSMVTVKNCDISSNKLAIGGYNYVTYDLTDVTMTSNGSTAEDWFPAVSLNNHCVFTADRITVSNNLNRGFAMWSFCTFDINNSVISGNGKQGFDISQGYGTLSNNLIMNNGSDGVNLFGNDSEGGVILENNTITNNAGNRGIAVSLSGSGTFKPTIMDCIISFNGYGIYVYSGKPTVLYSDVYGNTSGNYSGSYTNGLGNISQDPLFVSGPYGDKYLSQISAGQGVNSLCVDAGSGSAGTIGTTKTTGEADSGTIDMGYHYPLNNVGVIVINEILPNPAGTGGEEWVELYNPTDVSVNIGGCYLDDAVGIGSAPVQAPVGTIIPAHGFYTVTLPLGDAYFSNTSGTVTILKPDGISVVDIYSYSFTIDGASFYRYPDGGAWASGVDNTPTKNAPNDGDSSAYALIKYITPSKYPVADNLGVASTYYIDRTYTITELPADLSGAIWIKTGNAEKTNTSDSFLSFTLTKDAVVYVAYDSRATSLPNWLSGFTNTGTVIKTTDVQLKVYAKAYAAGKITLGGNLSAGAVGAGTNYVLAAKEGTSLSLIQYVQPTKYPVAEGLGVGGQYYIDRTYTITELPAELSGATLIKTGNADKANTSDSFLSFTLNRDAVVYVAYDSRATSLPNWLSGFTNTGKVLKTTDVQLKIYAKLYTAGRITLGGNLAAGAVGANTNYVVLAKEGTLLPLIQYVQPTKYPVAEGLGTGGQYYSDRTYTITELPADLSGASWIRTGNAEKSNTSDSFLTFTLNKDAIVYVAYDSRATSLPNWMSGFTNTGLVLKTTDVQLKIYAKFYNAGKITLGGNLAAGAVGAATNYVAIAKQGTQLALIKYVQPTKYPVAEGLGIGSQYYSDRTYTIAELPVELTNASWIKTGNADKTNTSEFFLTFTLTQDAMVYVAYDSRATSLPTWMSGFTNTGMVLKTTDVQLKIYAKFYNAGKVTLGGNMAAGAVGAATNYVVTVKK